jgi:penicillin amidase
MVRGWVRAGLALVVLLIAPAGAHARVIRAESIQPPGQSGFVSIPGLADGTGSPHLYDQLQPFIDFRWKNALFNQPGATETPKSGVRIVRDGYGVPAVTGDTQSDAWWGAGFAMAQDRLFELDLFRAATQGRLSEIAGADRVGDDTIVRQDMYTPGELDQMFAKLPADLQARFNSYRDGINAWMDHVRANPTDLPGEYPATGTTLVPWTTRDSVAIGVYLARTIPTNADPHSLELANLRAVQLSGAGVLDKLVPPHTFGSLTTIPKASGVFPSQPGRTAKDEQAGLRNSLGFAGTLPFPTGPQYRAVPGARAGPRAPVYSLARNGGSYMFAVRRRSDGHAILFNGPQLGFSAPERIVELEVHAPGLDARGLTAPGAPIIGAGHNGRVAWSITTGASDTDDLYAEKLVHGQPERYLFHGRVLSMDCRNEVINFNFPPANLTQILKGKVPPAPGSVTRRVCRTIHGPVEARAGDVAYARRYAAWGRELETLQGLAEINAAQDLGEVDRGARHVTWNENVMAIDSGGHIGFWHPGLFPLRPRNWDERLPFPGTGEAEWRGLLSRSQVPAVIDPKQGWLANWNNLPSASWTAGDGTARKRMDGNAFRVTLLFPLVQALARHPTFEGAQDVIRQAGTVAQQRPATEAALRRAASGATGGAATVLHALVSWDGSYARVDANNTVDPGVAAWDAFRAAAAKRAIAPLGAGAQWLADENVLQPLHPDYHTGSPYHYFDDSHFQSYALRSLSMPGYRAAAQDAFAVLSARFGTGNAAGWREPRRMFDFKGLAGASPPPLPFFDRGTYEQFIETGP